MPIIQPFLHTETLSCYILPEAKFYTGFEFITVVLLTKNVTETFVLYLTICNWLAIELFAYS